MQASPEFEEVVRQVETLWKRAEAPEIEVDLDKAREQFHYRLDQVSSIPSRQFPLRSRRSRWISVGLKVAALALLSLFAGLFVVQQMAFEEQEDRDRQQSFNVLQVLETENGEKARVTFSDGTRVILNSASSIRFPQSFEGAHREVWLEGEAYFDVAHDPEHPFVVRSQDTEIEVLGTEFNVRGWKEDVDVQVAVREGKVAVQSGSESGDGRSRVLLTEGLMTRVARGGSPVEPYPMEVQEQFLWTTGGIHFDNKPFGRVVQDLERRFDLEIVVEDANLLQVPYTGTFQYAELTEILNVMATSLGVGYEKNGSRIRFLQP